MGVKVKRGGIVREETYHDSSKYINTAWCDDIIEILKELGYNEKELKTLLMSELIQLYLFSARDDWSIFSVVSSHVSFRELKEVTKKVILHICPDAEQVFGKSFRDVIAKAYELFVTFKTSLLSAISFQDFIRCIKATVDVNGRLWAKRLLRWAFIYLAFLFPATRLKHRDFWKLRELLDRLRDIKKRTLKRFISQMLAGYDYKLLVDEINPDYAAIIVLGIVGELKEASRILLTTTARLSKIARKMLPEHIYKHIHAKGKRSLEKRAMIQEKILKFLEEKNIIAPTD